MLELVFVIVVIGILAAIALPRIERDLRQEAADNILAAIRYTQHLALNDNKTDPTDDFWQKKFWQIRFESDGNGGLLYKVGSNEDNGTNIDRDEAAIDPVNGKYMFASSTTLQPDESPNVLLGKKYGVDVTYTRTGSCSTVQHIAFDHLGRPHTGINAASNTYSTYMSDDCNMTFSFQDTSIPPLSIIVTKETGFAYIEGQESL